MISQISVIFWTDDEAHRKDFTTMLKLHLVLTPLYCPNSACFRPDISNFKSHWHKLSTKSHLDLKKSPCFTSGQLWTSEPVVGSLSLSGCNSRSSEIFCNYAHCPGRFSYTITGMSQLRLINNVLTCWLEPQWGCKKIFWTTENGYKNFHLILRIIIKKEKGANWINLNTVVWGI